jgi:superfamily II DNA/RNA helicase
MISLTSSPPLSLTSPHTQNTIIHDMNLSSGRTARAGSSGIALTLVSESQLHSFSTMMTSVLGPRFGAKLTVKEVTKRQKVTEEDVVSPMSSEEVENPTHVKPTVFTFEAKLFGRAHERAHAAARIVKLEEGVGRSNSSNNWYKQQAEAMEIELDEHIQDEQEILKESAGNQRELLRLKVTLKELLEEPLNGKRIHQKARTKRAGSSRTNQEPRQKKKKNGKKNKKR